MVNVIGRRIDITPIAPSPTEGIGGLLGKLGTALFGDTVTPALKREKLLELQDANAAREAVARNIGPDGAILDPKIAAIGAIIGATDPGKFGQQRMLDTAVRNGIRSDEFTAAAAGAGKWKETPSYGDQELANKLALQQAQEATKLTLDENKPTTVLDPNGRPTFVRQRDAIGLAAPVSMDQIKAGVAANELPNTSSAQRQRFAFGSEGGELGNATLKDGRTVPAYALPGQGIVNAETGEKLTGITSFGKLTAQKADDLKGASGDLSTLLKQRNAVAGLVSRLDNVDALLSKPNADAAVGPLGKAATFYNDMRSQAEAVFRAGGKDIIAQQSSPETQKALDGAMTRLFGDQSFNTRARQLGVDASILRSQITALAYDFAKANDPGGRMSDRDVANAAHVIGASILDPAAGRQVLAAQREQVLQQHQLVEDNFRTMFPQTQVTPWAYKSAQGTPAPAAPPAPALPPGSAPPPAPAEASNAPSAETPVPRQAPDGKFYLPDPNRPGKWLEVRP